MRRFLLANDVPLRSAAWARKLDPFETEVIAAFTSGIGVSQIAERYGVRPQTVLNFLAAQQLRQVQRRPTRARIGRGARSAVGGPTT